MLAATRNTHRLKVFQITEKAKAKNPNAGLSTERYLGDVERCVEVTGFAGQPRFFMGLAHRRASRKYPCTSWVTRLGALEQMRARPGSAKRAHWDVKLQHAPATVMTCATCHAENGCAPTRFEGAPVKTSITATGCARSAMLARHDGWAAGAHGASAPGRRLGAAACRDGLRAVPQPASAVGTRGGLPWYGGHNDAQAAAARDPAARHRCWRRLRVCGD